MSRRVKINLTEKAHLTEILERLSPVKSIVNPRHVHVTTCPSTVFFLFMNSLDLKPQPTVLYLREWLVTFRDGSEKRIKTNGQYGIGAVTGVPGLLGFWDFDGLVEAVHSDMVATVRRLK
jgi:hypothetical protein